MTRAGQSPVDRAILKRLARLVHIHHLTHPVRLAARYGLSVRYVRKQWEGEAVRDPQSLLTLAVLLDQVADEANREHFSPNARLQSRLHGKT